MTAAMPSPLPSRSSRRGELALPVYTSYVGAMSNSGQMRAT